MLVEPKVTIPSWQERVRGAELLVRENQFWLEPGIRAVLYSGPPDFKHLGHAAFLLMESKNSTSKKRNCKGKGGKWQPLKIFSYARNLSFAHRKLDVWNKLGSKTVISSLKQNGKPKYKIN